MKKKKPKKPIGYFKIISQLLVDISMEILRDSFGLYGNKRSIIAMKKLIYMDGKWGLSVH